MQAAPGDPLGEVDAGDARGRHPSPRRQKLDELFKEHAPYVARLAFRILGKRDEVDDVVQDVFITLFRRLESIRHSEALRSWLATTAVRLVRRRLRARRLGALLRWTEQEDVATLEAPAATSGEDRAALWKVHLALEQVSANARIAWIFRYIEQEGVDDVARLCGCSRSTAKRRIADAHAVVKRALSDD